MAGPGPGVEQVTGPLNGGQPPLRPDRTFVKHRMVVTVAAMDKRRIGFPMRFSVSNSG